MKPGSDDPARGALAFLEWARGAAVPISIPRHDADYDDLSFIGDVIGNARVVAFGENAHYLHEWNRFRARLFKYLVRDHGFSVFILESGLVEGRHIHDYVDGKDVPWERVVGSVTNGWGVWAELQELIVWMREYNADPASPRRLRFYSTDGSGNWAHARIAFDAVLAFLARVDGKTAERIEREFGDEMRRAKFAGRDRLDRAAWDRLIAGSARIVSLIEQQCIAWGDSDSREEYDWGLESARVLRHLVLNFAQTETDFSIGFRTFWNVRDYAMAEQVQWILDREGPGARAVIGAHNTHLQQYPVRVQRATSMGAYLAERIGRDNVLFIGAQSAYSVKGEEPLPESNQAVYGQSDRTATCWTCAGRPARVGSRIGCGRSARTVPICAISRSRPGRPGTASSSIAGSPSPSHRCRTRCGRVSVRPIRRATMTMSGVTCCSAFSRNRPPWTSPARGIGSSPTGGTTRAASCSRPTAPRFSRATTAVSCGRTGPRSSSFEVHRRRAG